MSTSNNIFLIAASVLSVLPCLAAPASAEADDLATADGETGQDLAILLALEDPRPMERFTVIGSTENAARLPGSVQRIDAADLEKQNYQDILRILRQVPGVNIQEEDGFGLRPNIGMRGTGLDRSEKVTLMEDGILFAPAPYAAPAAYFFPQAGRMSAVEVSKGPSAIKYGPNTTGGSINLVSTPIPEDFVTRLEGRGGKDSLLQVHATTGGTTEHVGFLLEAFHNQNDGFKRLDTGGDTGFNVDEIVGKLRLNSGRNADRYQEIELKFSYSDQTSDETYLGLTDADFAADPFRRYAASQKDLFKGEREHYQAQHFAELTDNLDLTSVLYYNNFRRNWFKLNNVVDPITGSQSISSVLDSPDQFTGAMAILKGEVTSADDALIVRNNNRAYEAFGLQSVLGYKVQSGPMDHQIELGLRYHHDKMDRFQWDDRFRIEASGAMVMTTAGTPGTQSNRIDEAKALALFVQDEIETGNWLFVPGLRFESIDTKRRDFGKTDPGRATSPAPRTNSVQVFIPGIGVTYQATDTLSLLAGVHKGFTSPGPGGTSDAETSVNYEIGTRYNIGNMVAEIIGFYNDFSNLVGTCTESTGGNCAIGDQFDGGKSQVFGVELDAMIDLAGSSDTSVSIPLRVDYTYTSAEFRTSFVSGFGPWGNVTKGDEVPYIPEHQITLSLGLEHEDWNANIALNHVGAVRHRAGQGPIAASDKIDGHTVLDVAGHYSVTRNITLTAAIENLTDTKYSVARRPAGLRPGKPRTWFLGINAEF